MALFAVKDFHPSNWYTTTGVKKKRREIEKRGLPDIKGCLFFTLTIDPQLGGAKETYERGKEQLRRFLEKLRKYWGNPEKIWTWDRDKGKRVIKTINDRHCFGWAWKLEFQQNGYAHWHLIVKTDKLIKKCDLKLLNKYWGLGRTNVKRIKNKDFRYLFKYVSKCTAYSDGENSGIALPSWVLDYQKIRPDGTPSTRIRFWQTGSGFYEGIGPIRRENNLSRCEEFAEDEGSEKRYSLVRYTIRDFVSIQARTGMLILKSGSRIVASKAIVFRRNWQDVRQRIVNHVVDNKIQIDHWGMYPPVEDIILEEIEIWQTKAKETVLQMQYLSKMV